MIKRKELEAEIEKIGPEALETLDFKRTFHHQTEGIIAHILFFIGFAQVTAPFENRIDLKTPLRVGFFLGGLVITIK